MTDGCQQTYSAKYEFPDHAENEVGPVYVKAEKHHQHHIEEVVAEKGRVVEDWVNPGTVDQPETQATEKQSKQQIFRGQSNKY